MNDDWYTSFFTGLVIDMWRAATPREATLAEAEFLVRELGVEPGDRLLDAPCGHGRHSIELAKRGFRVTGVDLSSEMLAVARRVSARERVEVDWHQAEMRSLPGGAAYDGAFCFGNSFGYLGPEGDREYVAAVAASLRPGGRFAIHTGMAAESLLPRLEERGWSPMGDVLFLEENRYDAAESCLETEYTFVRDGEAEVRTARHWIYTVRGLRELLANEGLVTLGLYSSPEGAPFALDEPELFLVAEKG